MTTTTNDITIYRADWLLPVSAPALVDGALAVAGERIVAVGGAHDLRSAHPEAPVVDLGNAIVMPGFVNCHSHLEYTSFRGILDDSEFGDWILSLIDVKAALTPEEYVVSAGLGTVEAISSGITTLADTSYGVATLKAASAARLRGRLYLEVFGVDDKHLDDTMADMERRLAEAQALAPPQFEVGLAPHAPYTVSSRLYQTVAAFAREHGLRVMSHVAESKDELTYVRSGSGRFAHDYREKMGWERMLVQPFGVTPVKYLEQWQVFDSAFLAAHCVLVSRDDIRILKAKDVAVAHCPKSNAKLGCGIAPLAEPHARGRARGPGHRQPSLEQHHGHVRRDAHHVVSPSRQRARCHGARRPEVRAHRHPGRRRGAGPAARHRQPRTRQVRRLHRDRRGPLPLCADRRPLLGARLWS